ncbi:hypothetical protein NDU88_011980 [Pleurodeles waltl]|uniref:Uncharacterized protein n=1 Tax=Pleurodeles waltl TaxID=8319 RepID=A0AAV7R0D1_PLEWA|nr:hypothetical protein NDU88_011980 [Pleurodeles waltl]
MGEGSGAGALMQGTMAVSRGRKDCSLKDMLTKPAKTLVGDSRAEVATDSVPDGGKKKAPVTGSFLEDLYPRREDLHSVKKALSSDLREVYCDLDAIGDRADILKDQGTSSDEE